MVELNNNRYNTKRQVFTILFQQKANKTGYSQTIWLRIKASTYGKIVATTLYTA